MQNTLELGACHPQLMGGQIKVSQKIYLPVNCCKVSKKITRNYHYTIIRYVNTVIQL